MGMFIGGRSTKPWLIWGLGTSLGLMYPVSQSKSWLQSSVGTLQVFSGGETPSWLYRDRLSGMLTSEVYFHCPSIFLMKLFGTPYQVAVLLVGGPKVGWYPVWVAVWTTGIVVL